MDNTTEPTGEPCSEGIAKSEEKDVAKLPPRQQALIDAGWSKETVDLIAGTGISKGYFWREGAD